jgi:hypothetical protein
MLAGLCDNPMPELTLSPSKGSRKSATVPFLAIERAG